MCRPALTLLATIITFTHLLSTIATLAICCAVRHNWNAWRMANGAVTRHSVNTSTVAHCNRWHTDPSDMCRTARSLDQRPRIRAQIRTNCTATISANARRVDRGVEKRQDAKRFVVPSQFWHRTAFCPSPVMIACTAERWSERPILVKTVCRRTSKNIHRHLIVE